MAKMTTFDRIGGFAAVSKIVLRFYGRLLDSDILAPYFDDIDMGRLIDHQTQFISSCLCGPASYTNDMLQQLHRHLDIDKTAFDEMGGLLAETLEDAGLSEDDVAQVMKSIVGAEDAIVNSPSKS